MKRLSKKQILMLHSQLIKATGGTNELKDEEAYKDLLKWIKQHKSKG